MVASIVEKAIKKGVSKEIKRSVQVERRLYSESYFGYAEFMLSMRNTN